ncbi:histidinol-phosphatase [Haloechinothrix sp. YIM 98757]|uniref:Histidinol-phosphatase n=1 Tax=Haloechinothrix aidingensis TaxID=2752311 RepID=A0A838AFK6_9PSEU|nr:histidinol-phosphatase [Haloechinothrix aidingensis]MBA0128043.1 histidinol-phosphatase [Haloechinothrix aidingensis]
MLAAAADSVTLDRFRANDLAVDRKPDRTPVTDADLAVEDAIRALLAEHRPEDLVAGEERGGDLDALAGKRVWVIDPIDGTKGFLRGLPVWATLIALVDDGTVTSGMVSAPALGRRWWAHTGSGAYTDDGHGPRPIAVSGVRSLSDAFLSTTNLATWGEYHSRAAYEALVDACWENRAFGDFWHHCLVAEGAIDLAAEPIVNPWDIAPFAILLSEAGGQLTDLSGVARLDGGNALSSNGRLHAEALTILEAGRAH